MKAVHMRWMRDGCGLHSNISCTTLEEVLLPALKQLSPRFTIIGLGFNRTQFQIDGGSLVQGVTKLITILLTFVT